MICLVSSPDMHMTSPSVVTRKTIKTEQENRRIYFIVNKWNGDTIMVFVLFFLIYSKASEILSDHIQQ